MEKFTSSKAERIARVASEFERERTGHPPRSVSVVMSGDTLVITLHGSLSAGEIAMAQSPEGAARILELHQQLFASSSTKLQEQIKAITGVEVREARTEVETTTGAIVQVFTTGTSVQVYLLTGNVPTDSWAGRNLESLPPKTVIA